MALQKDIDQGETMLNIAHSVVIPLKNEEGNIAALIEELEPVMSKLGKEWELICIDDGSTDQTWLMLQQLSKQKPYLKLIKFRKNYGQSSGFDAGFKKAQGEFVISLDGDGQNDPSDIPRLLALIPSCDLVCGIRLKRKDTFVKRITSKIANRIRNALIQDGVQDTGCSLKVYRKSALEKIKLYHGMHRFLPALFKIEGFSIKQIEVNHRERRKGKSNYNFFNRSFNTLADLWAVRWMKKRHLSYHIDQ
jgi:dolichol-phosphate mannosyltransferase